jgi:hypothetical protein
MIYLVINNHRSGSSMLMRCLEAGGIDPVYNKASDLMNFSAPYDYIPNPNGFYQFNGEVNAAFYHLYYGRLIKCPIHEATQLPPGEYKVILLTRDAAEVRASMARWTPFQSWGKAETVTYFQDEFMAALKSKLTARVDMDIIEVEYRDIVNSPEETFAFIQSSGWPIDHVLCAEKVDSSLYRNNLERYK